LPFQAGQYVVLDLPGGVGDRPFSIAGPPDAAGATAEVEFNIRLVPGGLVTSYVHQELRVGDRVSLSGPHGRFFVRKSAQRPMIFMAGGSGLASPRSMILDLLAESCALPITLVYGQRTQDELYYHGELLELSQRYENFTYAPVLSHEPENSAWAGSRGYVHDEAKRLFDGDFRSNDAYLCGPPLMIDACLTTLMQGRLFERNIYLERFISAADAQHVRSPLFRSV
jgi:phenol hydroxylase P5 protein